MKEYSILILFNLIGLLFLPLTNYLISLFVIVELQSYSFYLITAFNNESYYSSRAGLTYLLIAGLASIIILFGCASLYSATGLTSFDGLFSLLYHDNFYPNLNVGFSSMILGLLIKIGTAPMHNWLINIYSIVPTYVTAWVSLMVRLVS